MIETDFELKYGVLMTGFLLIWLQCFLYMSYTYINRYTLNFNLVFEVEGRLQFGMNLFLIGCLG